MGDHNNPHTVGTADYHRYQKAQQEMFIKSNLDYENRLRGHMYQFEDDNQATAPGGPSEILLHQPSHGAGISSKSPRGTSLVVGPGEKSTGDLQSNKMTGS